MLCTTSPGLWSVLAHIVLSFAHSGPYTDIETLERDICIIGGGSSGTYSAIRLQQMNKSVAVIERNDRLGGHVNTYIDPTTNKTFDYGVIIWDNITVVRDYFAYLDVPLGSSYLGGDTVSLLVDFANGSLVSASVLDQGNVTAAFLAYSEQLAKYPYLLNGFNLPDPVPADLLLTWGQFIEKYNLSALAYTVFEYNQGVGNILAQPALYMLKYLPATEVNGILTGSFVTTAHHDNQELYNRALAKLGSDAFTSSNVSQVVRRGNGVEVFLTAPDGPKLIKATKLLITIPPELSNLGFLDVDPLESSLFGQFNNSYYWDAVLKNSGIPDNTSLSNVDPTAPYSIPPMPGIYGFGPVADFPGLHTVYYSSPHSMTDDEVKADIQATNARLVESLGYLALDATPEFVGFNAHNPFELTVSTQAISDGFYGRLETLQGRRQTWWTGATWQGAQDSSLIWNYTEHIILPDLMA